MDRAIELLNDRLLIYNSSVGEYLYLVGDTSKIERHIEGDLSSQIKRLNIYGATTSNTNNYKLYWSFTDSLGTRTLSFFKDSSKTLKVLEGSIIGDGVFNLLEVSSSGLSGNAKIEYVMDDTDGGNIVYVSVMDGEIKINDINTGSISNPLEYLRRYKDFLIQQLDLRYAVGEILDYIAEEFYNFKRNTNETDTEFANRIIKLVTEGNSSPLVIQNILEDYGDNVQIIEGIDDGAFSDVSFSDCYRDFDGPPIIKAALTGKEGGMPYFFRVIMENVDPNNYKLIVEMIKRLKASGITYVIEII